MNYPLIITIVLALSFVFSLGGVGSATAIVPILVFLGENFNTAKNAGLFINVVSASMSTYHHHSQGRMEWKLALLLAVPAVFLAPLGAIFSQYLSHELLLLIFSLFLLYSATVLIFFKKRENRKDPRGFWLVLIGSITGFFAGLLGIGGGALISPLLNLLGMDPKRVARITSLVVFLSSLSGFITYTLMGHIDLKLLGVAAVPAIIGGYLGAHMMHHKLSSQQLKVVIGGIFYILAIKGILSII